MPVGYVAVVTGGTGFVATHLVSQLLSKGYGVRATVRSLKKEDHIATLKALGSALPGMLTLHEADLLKEGAFDEVIRDAHFVFHTASPFFIKAEHDAQKELIDPALKGTQNVLGSVVKAKDTVKRVVLTSSVAAIASSKGPKNGKLYTEDDWNETATLEDSPYLLSKVLAEKEAWKLAEQHSLDLVAVCPNFIQGPALSPTLSGTSVGHLKGWLEGKAGGNPVYCDVRDVVDAHIAAAETPTASGRYMVTHTHSSNPKEVSDMLQERFPEYDIPAGEDKPAELQFDVSKTESELGVHNRPLRETVVDGAVTLIDLGIAKPRRK